MSTQEVIPTVVTYRELCKSCLDKEEARKGHLPFKEGPSCPMCATYAVRWWKVVCKGKQAFLLERGHFGTKWGQKTFSCNNQPGDSVPHFHLACAECDHRWKMRVATP